jgi:Fe-S cluster assembly iron-binding protein IscA
MILISNGAGIFVALIWLVSLFAGDRLAEVMFGSQASPRVHNLTGEWLAAALTLAFALFLRLQRTVAVDPATGTEVVTRPPHSLFWIPVIVWPVIFFALGVIVYYRTPAGNPALFEVAPAAVEKIKGTAAAKSMPRGWYLRVEVFCKEGIRPPQYSLDLVTEVNPTRDYQFKASGLRIVVLKRQVDLLRDAQVDVGGKDGETFVVKNPNLEGSLLEKRRRDLELERPTPPK